MTVAGASVGAGSVALYNVVLPQTSIPLPREPYMAAFFGGRALALVAGVFTLLALPAGAALWGLSWVVP